MSGVLVFAVLSLFLGCTCNAVTYSSMVGYIGEDFFTVTVSSTLDATKVPSTTTMNVQVNGMGVSVSAISISDATFSVTITGMGFLLAGDIIDVIYAAPATPCTACFQASGPDYLASFSHSIVISTGRPDPPPTPGPTHEPTAVPTHEPTRVPTSVPTHEPTAVPTHEPTAVPTPVPTHEPTAVPTAVPTDEPTAVPTYGPTPVPTHEPTAVPTAVPTHEPTPVPSPVPTHEPTSVPTPAPTLEPTREPTAVPTAVPTHEPTPVPSPVPTHEPTSVPTPAPTPEPTLIPTPQPTAVPTSEPTRVPTFEPSFEPTLEPPTLHESTITFSGGNWGAVLANQTARDELNQTLAESIRETLGARWVVIDSLSVGSLIAEYTFATVLTFEATQQRQQEIINFVNGNGTNEEVARLVNSVLDLYEEVNGDANDAGLSTFGIYAVIHPSDGSPVGPAAIVAIIVGTLFVAAVVAGLVWRRRNSHKKLENNSNNCPDTAV